MISGDLAKYVRYSQICRGFLILGCSLAATAIADPVQTEDAKLVSTNPWFAGFGAPALEGDIVTLGSPGDDEVDDTAGAVYVFARDASGVWSEQAKLLPDSIGFYSAFGVSVDVEGNTVIGGVWEDDLAPNDAAYVFVRDEMGGWTEQGRLLPHYTDYIFNDMFARDVAIDGDTSLVGRAGVGDVEWTSEPPRAGSAMVFARDMSGTWAREAELVASDGELYDRFGRSVELDGDIAVITKRASADSPGVAYIFERDNSGVWSEQFKLDVDVDTPDTYKFAHSTAIENNTVAVRVNDHIYILARDESGQWAEESVHTIPSGPGFGSPVFLSGGLIVIGGVVEKDVYILTGSDWTKIATLSTSDGGDLGSASLDDQTVVFSGGEAAYVYALRLPVNVAVDIRPENSQNIVNLRSRGVVSVAVLTTEIFDATQIDVSTVAFGPSGASEAHERAHIADIDADGDMDVLFHFRIHETGIECLDTEATLTGNTFGGQPIYGTDAVSTMHCQ